MKCTCVIVPSSWPTFYALRRTRLHCSVTFAALYLLQCLKARFLAAFTTYTLRCTCLHPSVTFVALYLLQHLKARNYFGIHATLQDHLRQHIFMGCRQSRHPSPGPLTLHSSPSNVPSTSSTSKGMLPSHPHSPPRLLTRLSAQRQFSLLSFPLALALTTPLLPSPFPASLSPLLASRSLSLSSPSPTLASLSHSPSPALLSPSPSPSPASASASPSPASLLPSLTGLALALSLTGLALALSLTSLTLSLALSLTGFALPLSFPSFTLTLPLITLASPPWSSPP